MTNREVLTVDGAAEFLGMSPYTIREMARRGDLPGRKIGKEWRFLREALVEWIRNPGSRTQGSHVPRTGRCLRISPAPRGSGRQDISQEHDRYFAGG